MAVPAESKKKEVTQTQSAPAVTGQPEGAADQNNGKPVAAIVSSPAQLEQSVGKLT